MAKQLYLYDDFSLLKSTSKYLAQYKEPPVTFMPNYKISMKEENYDRSVLPAWYLLCISLSSYSSGGTAFSSGATRRATRRASFTER